MATNDFFGATFEKQVKAIIEAEINRAAEPIIKQALEDIEKRMRERVAAAAVHIARQYSMQRHGDDLMITVRIDPDKVKF